MGCPRTDRLINLVRGAYRLSWKSDRTEKLARSGYWSEIRKLRCVVASGTCSRPEIKVARQVLEGQCAKAVKIQCPVLTDPVE